MFDALRLLNLTSSFFQLSEVLMADHAISVAVVVLLFFGDFLFVSLFPEHATSGFLGGFDTRIRLPNGRYKK